MSSRRPDGVLPLPASGPSQSTGAFALRRETAVRHPDRDPSDGSEIYSPAGKATTSRRHFGNQPLLRESSRDAKLFYWLESMLQDVRFGLQMLRKNAGSPVAAVLSLSLAIGACTAAFSLIDALSLRPLPVRDPGELMYCSYPPFGLSLNEDTFTSDTLLDRFVANQASVAEDNSLRRLGVQSGRLAQWRLCREGQPVQSLQALDRIFLADTVESIRIIDQRKNKLM
jgi:hypothetical protein